jgi:hypothetical protein
MHPAVNPDLVWEPGAVRVRAKGIDQFEGKRGAAYIKARGLDKPRERLTPDRASLEIAHRWLGLKKPLDDMLAEPIYRIILENVARRHMQRREQLDVKKLQANDID